MAKRKFKAESDRMLDLMINSVYTNKEIFLRELVSNASDAIDKLYYRVLVDKVSGVLRGDFFIRLSIDKDNRLLTIEDNGIGMTKDELAANLGTIAKSGSLSFMRENAPGKDSAGSDEVDGIAGDEVDIIGQFGVGFYSAFMVSDEIRVESRAYGEDKAYVWRSKGVDGYTIDEIDKEDAGTKITLTIKESAEGETYDDYLNPYHLQSLIKRYSDFIRYPIRMMLEGEEKVLNSMVPLWKRPKKDITEEDYANFYKEKWNDPEDPRKVIHTSVEGVTSYDAILFIPSSAPFNYYTRDYEKGLQLYSSGVMIMERCAELLPDYFAFVRGVVDSQDLSLNISREMLQNDRQLKAIAMRLEKKIKTELETMLKNKREDYEGFWESFGLQLKFGVYDNFGMQKDQLKDLLMFYSSSQEGLSTLAEYTARMKDGQEFIYYAAGDSVEKIDRHPQTEILKQEGYDVLYLTDDVDEFALRILAEYDGKQFKSASEGDAEAQGDDQEAMQEHKELLDGIKEALDGKVKEVRLSSRLKDYPVRLVSGEGISFEMEKVLNAMPSDEKVKADRILEINADTELFKLLERMHENGEDGFRDGADVLYGLALLQEGIALDDPVSFSRMVGTLLGTRAK